MEVKTVNNGEICYLAKCFIIWVSKLNFSIRKNLFIGGKLSMWSWSDKGQNQFLPRLHKIIDSFQRKKCYVFFFGILQQKNNYLWFSLNLVFNLSWSPVKLFHIPFISFASGIYCKFCFQVVSRNFSLSWNLKVNWNSEGFITPFVVVFWDLQLNLA